MYLFLSCEDCPEAFLAHGVEMTQPVIQDEARNRVSHIYQHVSDIYEGTCGSPETWPGEKTKNVFVYRDLLAVTRSPGFFLERAAH